MAKLKPDYYLDSIYDIPYGKLWENNIRGLIFDIDNTIASYEEHRPSAKVVALMKRLKRMGFSICLLTNNTNKRLKLFSEPLEVHGIANATKPLARGVRKAMNHMRTKPKFTAIIGDQILADIWAGKSAGINTILVKPLSKKDLALVQLRRRIEVWLLKRYYPNQ